MKELLLFSFVAIFIACQNQPLSNHEVQLQTQAPISTASSVSEFERMNCGNESHDAFDLAQELTHSAEPGIHHRQVVRMSEAVSELKNGELVCISQVTHLPEEQLPALEAVAVATPQPETWEILTRKWALIPETVTCLDRNRLSQNPMCEDVFFFAEDGKLFSARFESSSDQL